MIIRIIGAVIAALALGAHAQAETLERMAGQMIVVGFQGDSLDDAGAKAVISDLEAGRLGGVMFLKFNVASRANVVALNQAFRWASGSVPPLLTIDQEGGAVERLTSAVGFQEIPDAFSIAQNNSPAEAGQIFGRMANGVAEWGFNLNFGPVVDLRSNVANPIIAKFGRAFSADPEEVSDYAAAFISAHSAAGVLTALKHFPGHGSSAADSHEGFVDISGHWTADELRPFASLISANRADLVMAGHLFADVGYGGDSQRLPASLSKVWITDVLRGELGFSGVVITDDMEMGAIRSLYSFEDAILQAVRAGTDLLLFSNTANYRASLAAEIQAILTAEAQRDPAFLARIEESYARILALKRSIH